VGNMVEEGKDDREGVSAVFIGEVGVWFEGE
jgi:hypothetical protein